MKHFLKIFIALSFLGCTTLKAQYSVGLQGGVQFQNGDNAKDLTTGFGGALNFGIKCNENSTIKLLAGNYGFKGKHLPDGYSTDLSFTPVEIFYEYGVRLKKFRPYAEVGLGMVFTNRTSSYPSITDTSTFPAFSLKSSQRIIITGFGLGTYYTVNPHIMLNFNVQYYSFVIPSEVKSQTYITHDESGNITSARTETRTFPTMKVAQFSTNIGLAYIFGK